MELIEVSQALMPAGQPDFLSVVKYKKISELENTVGRSQMLKSVFLIVKDFCSSLNVVRNMNEDQMIECAAMLLDECDNFRLEDYVMMFQMAKKGQLVKIMDRVDINLITLILDEYWLRRRKAAEDPYDEEMKHLDSLGSPMLQLEKIHPDDARMVNACDGLTGAISDLKAKYNEWKNDKP